MSSITTNLFLWQSLILLLCPYTNALSTVPLSQSRIPIFFDSTNHLHRSLTYHPEQPARIQHCVEALQALQKQYNIEQTTETSELNEQPQIRLVDVAPSNREVFFSVTKENDENGVWWSETDTTQHQPLSDAELQHAKQILLQIHDPSHIQKLERRCRNAKQCRIDEGRDPLGFVGYVDDDTYVTTFTYDVCLRATAAWIRAVDSCVCGDIQEDNNSNNNVPQLAKTATQTAMALTRPPGHHATFQLSNGFCHFNFAAAAAVHYLQTHHPTAKVSILDWDVHYGQGVADIIQSNPQIRYASIHQVPAFPYMGTKREEKGNILTIPMTAETTWIGYHEKFQQALDFLIPVPDDNHDNDNNDDWIPDLVIVCAGYDGLDSDELASVSLNAKDFGGMTQALMTRLMPLEATSTCKLVLGLEGGYQLSPMAGGGNLPDAVVETVRAILMSS